MIKPIFVLVYFAFEPLRKFPQMINELSVEVLYASLNFTLVLRIRRMSKMGFNVMLQTPALPLFSELWFMITKNGLRKLPLFFQNRYCFSSRQVMVKLVRTNNKATIVINANQKPELLTSNTKWASEINLPKFIRLTSPKEIPAFKLIQV